MFDAEFEIGSDNPAEGRRYATLRKPRANHRALEWWADLSQTLDVASYRDKRVRLRAWVRADVRGARESAYLWMRVRRPRTSIVYASGIVARAIGSPRWTREDVEIVVPSDALSLVYGLALFGEGEASIDGVEIMVVDRR